MRIGVISDVHANYEALTAVLRVIHDEGVDLIINSGDNIGFSAFPNECVSLISESDIGSLMGNHDDAGSMCRSSCWSRDSNNEKNRIRAASLKWTQEKILDETRKYLARLPLKREIVTGFGKIIMFHAGLENLIQWITADDCDQLTFISSESGAKLVIMGHTHKPFATQIDGTVFVNPGSVGRPFDGDPRASFAIIDFAGNIKVDFRRAEYDIEKNIKALISAGLPSEIGIMLRHGRDFDG